MDAFNQNFVTHMAIIIQDATEYSLFQSVNLRVVFHPSSGAHNTLSTVSGINEAAKDKTKLP